MIKRLIKPFLIWMVGVSSMTMIISSLLPGEVMNARSVMVAASPEVILKELADLQTWPAWNLLLQDASGVNFRQSDTVSAKNASLLWKDLQGRSHSIVLTETSPKGIMTTMVFSDGKPMESGFSVERRRPDSVQVYWYVIEELAWYPWEKFYGMVSADMKEDIMEQSLLKFRDWMHVKLRK